MRRFCLGLLSFILLLTACSNSKKSAKTSSDKGTMSIPHLIKAQQPDVNQYRTVNVYVDSVQIYDQNGNKVLLIKGNLPNPCSSLKPISHQLTDQKNLQLTVEAWQPKDKMCTQVLQPFAYLYDQVPADQLDKIKNIQIGNKAYSLE